MCAVCEMRQLGTGMRRLRRLVLVAVVGAGVIGAAQGDAVHQQMARAAPHAAIGGAPTPAAG